MNVKCIAYLELDATQKVLYYKGVILAAQHQLTRTLNEISVIKGTDISQAFVEWASLQPYSLGVCANYCKNLALIGIPLPWEEGHSKGVQMYHLERMKKAFK